MKNQLQDDIAESNPYLEKPSGRRSRLEKSEKARKHRTRRNKKMEKEYEDGFRGKYE